MPKRGAGACAAGNGGGYAEPDRDRYLNLQFRLQIVAGQYPEAVATLQSLMELRRATDRASVPRLLPFVVDAKARAK